MESLDYKLEGIFQDYPFGYNDLVRLNDAAVRSAAMALILGQPNFNENSNYIISGITYDGTKYVGGWAYIDGHVVKVDNTTMSQAGSDVIKLSEVNVEAILWGDGQTRNSIVEYKGVIAASTGASGEYQLSSLTRIEHKGLATLAANFTSSGVNLTKFRGTIKINGRVTFTGGSTPAVGTVVCTLPAEFRPAYDYTFDAPGKTGQGATQLCRYFIDAASGEVRLMADNINPNDPLYLVGEWPV